MTIDYVRFRVAGSDDAYAEVTYRVDEAAADEDVETLASALMDCSSGLLQQATREYYVVDPVGGNGANGDYPCHYDRAVLLFTDEMGATFQALIVAPVDIFVDGETVDESNIEVEALITAILAVCTNTNGSPLAEYLRGWRTTMQT